MDDLSDTQFGALAKVLSLPSSTRDFKYLLTPSNLQEVFVEHEYVVVLSVPCLHFEGLGNARAKERVLNRLLARIASTAEAWEYEKVEEMAVGDDFPLLPPPRCNSQERQKRLRESFSDTPIESCHRARPFVSRDNQIVPRAKEFSNTPYLPVLARLAGLSRNNALEGE